MSTTQQTRAIATVTESRRDALSSSSSVSYIQPLALWSQGACVSSLLKLANSRILHNIVVIANPLVIAKTVFNLTKTISRPTNSRISSPFSFSLSISNYLSIIYLSFFHNICHRSSFLWWNFLWRTFFTYKYLSPIWRDAVKKTKGNLTIDKILGFSKLKEC